MDAFHWQKQVQTNALATALRLRRKRFHKACGIPPHKQKSPPKPPPPRNSCAAAGVLAYKGCAPAGAAAVHAPQATPRFAKAERCRPFLQCRKVLFALLTTVFYLRNTGGSRVRAGDYASTVPPRTQNTPSTVGLQRTPRETHSSITCPPSRNR